MPPAEYVTTDFFLSAFLVHKGANLLGLRRLGPKKVEFRFEAGEDLHALLRLYWSGHVVPVIPWEMFLCYHRLKCLSIDRYEPPPDDSSRRTPPPTASPLPMPTNDEWRKILARDDLTDEEVGEFAEGIRTIIVQFLDEYFRDEFEPDEV